jgi:predicted RecB family nuclease
MTAITASMLYNLVQCPRRVALDCHGDQAASDTVSPFIAMLWRRGTDYEQEILQRLELEVVDLSLMQDEDKEQATLAAMQRGEPLIYGGRIRAGDLLGIPDLLRRNGDGYTPVDIKSGRGDEGGGGDEEDGKPKLHYAVQLALYVDVLEQLGQSAGRTGIIFDIHGREVPYNLQAPRGPRTPLTLWDEYQMLLGDARAIAGQIISPKGAWAAACKLCHWRSVCEAQLRRDDDLTLIPTLGRAQRDSLETQIPTVAALAAFDPEPFIEKGKTAFKGVGPDRLRTFRARAKLLNTPGAVPYLKADLSLPVSAIEYFFDIEVDPLRDHTYLHGIVERRSGDNETERFIAFFTQDESPESEREAFAKAVAFLAGEPQATIYYYSKYERTIYRKLQARYPDVCSLDEIEALFDPAKAVDLYNDAVVKATEWPTNDQSIKTLAKYLGFTWRDTDPSGAASIEWFDRWVRSRAPETRQRILDYNEDDCRATRVLLDGIRGLAPQAV